MKATKFVLALGVALVVLLSPRAVLADSYSSFTVTGTFAENTTLGGTFTLDVTTGVITAADLTWSAASSDLTQILPGFNPAGYSGQIVGDQGGDEVSLLFDTPSLIGYSGGSLCSAVGNCPEPPPASGAVYSGYARLAPPSLVIYPLESGSVVATPEPSSLLLLSIGLLGSVAARRKLRHA